MTKLMRKVFASLVPVVCPPEARELGISDDLIEHIALQTAVLPALMSRGMALGLLSYDLGALAWLPARGRRAHKLPPHLARRYFETWLHGPTGLQRQLAIAVKQLLALAHYEHPLVQQRMGYRPQQWIEKVKRRRLELYADDIAKHQASLIAPDPLPGVRQHRKKERV
jgi:hypothetical protein